MKKLIMALLITFASYTGVQAQEVYKEIMRLSKNVANDKTKDIQSRKIATFKIDALNYMAMKMNEIMPDSAISVLDQEAYNMYDFVNLYIKKLSEVKSKKAKAEILEVFKTASLQNSRFNDFDVDVTEGYIRTEGYLTQFSLDTNWGKAIEQVREELKKRKQ